MEEIKNKIHEKINHIVALVCFHGINPHLITQERAYLILRIISDPDKRKILISIKNEFKTVSKISSDTQLSISTVYRKINDLNENNILISSGTINNQGKKEFSYKSKIQKIVTVFGNDEFDVRIYTNLR